MKFIKHNKNLINNYGLKNPLQELINKRGINKMEEEYKKVEETIFKFEKEGDEIKGILKSVEPSANYNNKVYKLKTVKDEILVVFGTKVLDSRMSSVSVGDDIKIVMTGIKPATVKGMNNTKLFEVFIK